MILGVTAGAAVAGIAGAFFAVPLIATANSMITAVARYSSPAAVPEPAHKVATIGFARFSGTDTMLKTYQGDAYIFAGVGLAQKAGQKTFTLPAGVHGTTVTVVDENRTIPVTAGKFTDSFAAESSHHIYKVSIS